MNVRLEPKDLDTICTTFRECFDENDHLWLFGSRVYPEKRGGDIDLYIEVDHFEFKKIYDQQNQFWSALQDRLGEQKIDIVVRDPKLDLLIYKVALDEGVRIV